MPDETQTTSSRPVIFICYAHKDNDDAEVRKRCLDLLLMHLEPLKFDHDVVIWCDRALQIGDEWNPEILANLQSAKVAIALLSPAFFASSYIRTKEVPMILEQQDKGQTELLPIMLSPCLVAESQFRYVDRNGEEKKRSLNDFQASNDMKRPLKGLPEHEQDAILLRVAQRVRGIITGKKSEVPIGGELGKETPIQRMPRGTETFVGRDEVLEELHDRLQTDQPVAICAMSGMGGIGKTELALQYVLRHQKTEQYPGKACWIDARQLVGSQILEFARVEFGFVPPELPDMQQLVRVCWERFPDQATLIVFDDVQEYAEIRDFLPPKESRFKVLLTTRERMPNDVHPLKIEVLSEAAALDLLRALVTDGRIDAELETAKQVCAWLGGLPLGLELVGRYLARKPDTTVAKLYERLKAKRLAAKPLLETKGETTARLGVRDAFELSWQELGESAQGVAKLLSGFAAAAVRWEWVEACWQGEDEDELEELRDEELLELHLLTRVKSGVYQLHPLLREFFAEKMTWEERKQIQTAVAQVMVEVAKQIPYSPTLALIDSMTLAIPHMQVVAEDLMRLERREDCGISEDEDVLWIFVGISRFYEGQGLYADAEPSYAAGLNVVRSLFGENHPNVATSLNNVANLYRSQGRYEEAELLYKQALKLWRSLFGENYSEVATGLNNLAGLYELQGRYEEAEPLYSQTLGLMRSLFGENHPEVATVLNNLANLYQLQGRYEEAEPLYRQALELMRSLFGENHPEVATVLNNLANLYQLQGRYEEAEPLYIQALELRKSLLGEHHPNTAVSLNDLAGFYHLRGCYEQAESFYKQALELRQFLFAESHPHVAISLNNLADLYRSQGRYKEAEPFYLQALESSRSFLGEIHPEIATILNNLAGLYHSQGQYEQAEVFHLQALKLRQSLFEESHPDVATSLGDLAMLYHSQGRYEEAESFSIQALKLSQSLLGEAHPIVATHLNNLATIYESQARYTEAEPFLLQALEIRRSILGKAHPDVAGNLSDLAVLYQSQERYTEAEPLFLQALEIKRSILGETHPNVAISLNNLAVFYQSQERYTEAELLFLQALEIRRSILGETHPGTAESMNNLAFIYRLQGYYDQAESLYKQTLKLMSLLYGETHPNLATSLNNLAALYQVQERYEEAEPLFSRALQIGIQTLGENHPNVAIRLNNLSSLYEILERYTEAESMYLKALNIFAQHLGADHSYTQTVRENFIRFLRRVIQQNRISELSDDLITRSILQQLQSASE